MLGGVAIDITERKRYEDALSEADQRKNEFLAMLAHELRNPLAPIRNSLEIMRRSLGADSSRSDSVGSAVEVMERQVGQMVRLVDDLLDLGRISRGKIELRANGSSSRRSSTPPWTLSARYSNAWATS